MRILSGAAVGWFVLGCAVAEGAPMPTSAVAMVAAPASEPGPRAVRHDDLLAYVPADAPYVFAVLEPAPRDYVRRIEPVLAPIRAAIQGEIDGADPATLDPELRVLVDELDGRVSAQGLRELGLDPNPRWVVYGIGLAPVLRLRLHDAARFEVLLRRIDAADGELWPTLEQPGLNVWRTDAFDTAIAWGIVGGDWVVTAYPSALEAQIAPQAFGVHMPTRSLADTGWAKTMRREHGLVAHGLGRIDLRAIADAWAGRGSGTTATTARAWDLVMDEPCGAAVRSAIARAPELVFGLTELSDAAVRGRLTWRMDAPLVADLAEVAGPLPKTRDGVAASGFAIDMARVETIARRWATDLHRAAPECVDADAWRQVVLPESIASVRGGAATLHAYDPRDEAVSYTAVLALSEPERWLTTMLPSLSLRDWPKRRPIPAKDVLSWAELDEAFVARTSDAIALASGSRARRHARRAARASGRDDDTLFFLHLGFGQLKQAIPARMLRKAFDELEPNERALADGILALLGDYDARIFVGDAGLTADWSLRLR
jgi:hypothetical protein